MDWHRLISDKRLGMEQYHSASPHTRTDFRRDYDRLVFSSPFRRLQNKTQVFPLPGHIFVHNRLTHSLEVASVGRSLASEVHLLLSERGLADERLVHIPDIVSAACLCHDLGNPPFGHSGEKTIATFFSEGPGLALRERLTEQEWADLIHFEGNANSFRVLTHQFVGRREGGFAMTYSTLASIVKYPYSSLSAGDNGKFGYFASEEPLWHRIADELGIPEVAPGQFARHPLVYLLEAADDICYQVMDIEDAHKLKLVTTNRVKRTFLNFFEDEEQERMERVMERLSDPNEQVAYMRSKVIGVLVNRCAHVFVDREEQIMEGSLHHELVELLPERQKSAYDLCTALAWEKIYRSSDVVDVEIAGNRIITSLLEVLTEAVIHPERNFSQLVLERVPQQYDTRSATLYGRLQSVLDHVSGMTDVYALDLYRKLTGQSLPAV